MFGMGTGGSSPLSSPAKGDCLRLVEDRAKALMAPRKAEVISKGSSQSGN